MMVQKFSVSQNKEYHIHFRVHKKLPPGQSIHILGGIPELGMWDKTKIYCRMKWTEGDFWVTEKPIITNKYFFQMKYAIMDNGSEQWVAYETGIDRLVDAEIKSGEGSNERHGFVFNARAGRDAKFIIMDDVYEVFHVCFSVNHPEPDLNDEIKIIGKKG